MAVNLDALRCGWKLGKKVAIAGAAISSAPLVVPPLLLFSSIGLACAVPVGIYLAAIAATEKVMSSLLPLRTGGFETNKSEKAPPFVDSAQLESVEDEDGEKEKEAMEFGYGIEDDGEAMGGGFGEGLKSREEKEGGEEERKAEHHDEPLDAEKSMEEEEDSNPGTVEKNSKAETDNVEDEEVVGVSAFDIGIASVGANPAMIVVPMESMNAEPVHEFEPFDAEFKHVVEENNYIVGDNLVEEEKPVEKESKEEETAGVATSEVRRASSCANSVLYSELPISHMDAVESEPLDGELATAIEENDSAEVADVVKESKSVELEAEVDKIAGTAASDIRTTQTNADPAVMVDPSAKEYGLVIDKNGEVECADMRKHESTMEKSNEEEITGVTAESVPSLSMERASIVEDANEGIIAITRDQRPQATGLGEGMEALDDQRKQEAEGVYLSVVENDRVSVGDETVNEKKSTSNNKEDDGFSATAYDSVMPMPPIDLKLSMERASIVENANGEILVMINESPTRGAVGRESIIGEEKVNKDEGIDNSGGKIDQESEVECSALSSEYASGVEDQSWETADTENRLSMELAQIATPMETEPSAKDEGSWSEEEIWEQIYSLRTIMGYDATLKMTCSEELNSLYLFAGIEPPVSAEGSSDFIDVNYMLQFLKSVIGVK